MSGRVIREKAECGAAPCIKRMNKGEKSVPPGRVADLDPSQKVLQRNA